MNRKMLFSLMGTLVWMMGGCATAYKAQPLPFKTPAAYGNAAMVGNAEVAAKAFADPEEAKSAFGFDIRKAGMLPVQIVIDNRGQENLEIVGTQTFLEDQEGNLWPVLDNQTAYSRASQFSQTQSIVKEGAYSGMLAAAAGGIIGAAVGIVTNSNVGTSAAKGAAVGAAAGMTAGGIKGYGSDEARKEITSDLKRKSLENKPVPPNTLANGIMFFPGEAKSAKRVRVQIVETGSRQIHVLHLDL